MFGGPLHRMFNGPPCQTSCQNQKSNEPGLFSMNPNESGKRVNPSSYAKHKLVITRGTTNKVYTSSWLTPKKLILSHRLTSNSPPF